MCEIGEGPIYRPEDDTLHYVDPLTVPPEVCMTGILTVGTRRLITPFISRSTSYRCPRMTRRRRGPRSVSQAIQFPRSHSGRTIPDLTSHRRLLGSHSWTRKAQRSRCSNVSGDLLICGFCCLEGRPVLVELLPESVRGKMRFNDGAVDCKGRFWVGEMDQEGSQIPLSDQSQTQRSFVEV